MAGSAAARTSCGLEVNLLLLDHEESRFDACDQDGTALEIGIVAPGAVESSLVVTDRVDIEVAHFHRVGRIGDVQDAQTSTVIGLVHEVALNVQVVV